MQPVFVGRLYSLRLDIRQLGFYRRRRVPFAAAAQNSILLFRTLVTRRVCLAIFVIILHILLASRTQCF